jgi:hypothetical protein
MPRRSCGKRHGGQIKQPGRDDTAAPPHFGNIGEIQGESLTLGQARIGLAMQDAKTFGIGLHIEGWERRVDMRLIPF